MRKTINSTAPKCNKSSFFFYSNFVISKFNILKNVYVLLDIFCLFLVWLLQKEVQLLLVEIQNSNKHFVILYNLRKLINLSSRKLIDQRTFFCFGATSGNPPRVRDSFHHYLQSTRVEGPPFSNLIWPIYSPFKCNLFFLPKQSCLKCYPLSK